MDSLAGKHTLTLLPDATNGGVLNGGLNLGVRHGAPRRFRNRREEPRVTQNRGYNERGTLPH